MWTSDLFRLNKTDTLPISYYIYEVITFGRLGGVHNGRTESVRVHPKGHLFPMVIRVQTNAFRQISILLHVMSELWVMNTSLAISRLENLNVLCQ